MFRDFTDEESGLIQRVQAHQKGLIARGHSLTELLVCVAQDGVTIIDDTIGSNDRVELTAPMLQEIATNGGCILIHNHPSEGSLSYSDWSLAAGNPGIGEIVAVNSSGSIFRGRTIGSAKTSLESKIKVGDVAPDVGQAVLNSLWDLFKAKLVEGIEMPNPGALENLMSWIWSHLVNERLKELGLVEYEATLSEVDVATLSDAELAPFIETGRGEVAKRV
ncbi:MAG: hypothetical protein ACOVOE_15110 [Caulobacter sp.]